MGVDSGNTALPAADIHSQSQTYCDGRGWSINWSAAPIGRAEVCDVHLIREDSKLGGQHCRRGSLAASLAAYVQEIGESEVVGGGREGAAKTPRNAHIV